jgi:hypothetical protein
MEEIWKDVKGFNASYQVSDMGRVRSLDRFNSAGNKIKGRLLKLRPNDKGYFTIKLYLEGKAKSRTVHQLVAESFLNHEPCRHRIVVDHIDNDKQNNNLTNLQLISQRENSSKNNIGKTSRYTGVSLDSSRNKYVANCLHNKKRKFLGRFDTELEASEAYNNYLKTINKCD